MGTKGVFSFQKKKTKLFIFTRYQSSKNDIILHQKFNLVRALLYISMPMPISFFSLFSCFYPKSTAMVMAGWSVHLTTLFPGQP